MASVPASVPAETRHAILARLGEVLGQARDLGYLGPGPIEDHVTRALDLAVAAGAGPEKALDLGSGGGVPALPLALLWPASTWVLLEASTRRSGFLEQALDGLGLSGRATVRAERAETAGRSPMREEFDLVVARGFGGPAVTAECAAPFLRPGGRLVVAEPPGGAPSRWDVAGLGRLGMALGPGFGSPTACQALIQEAPCPERYPRRVGVPSKRPLW